MISKVLHFFLVICGVARAAYIATGVTGPSLAAAGNTIGTRTQDDRGNYAFNYQIVDAHGSTQGRTESGTGHYQQGSYNIAGADGRSRRVDYVADSLGFRATINTNEPGTLTSNPAGATYNTPYASNPAPAGVAQAVSAAKPAPAVGYAIAPAPPPAYPPAPAPVSGYPAVAAPVAPAGYPAFAAPAAPPAAYPPAPAPYPAPAPAPYPAIAAPQVPAAGYGTVPGAGYGVPAAPGIPATGYGVGTGYAG